LQLRLSIDMKKLHVLHNTHCLYSAVVHQWRASPNSGSKLRQASSTTQKLGVVVPDTYSGFNKLHRKGTRLAHIIRVSVLMPIFELSIVGYHLVCVATAHHDGI
jgi:hypothetical protein